MNLCSESRAAANTTGANLDPVKLPEIWYQVGFYTVVLLYLLLTTHIRQGAVKPHSNQ